ncbi:phosphatase [Sphingorhabdus lutea]|uniref:Phosphatase n=1 Tax=Sphingorhabdus lutea TaxID=1913578 RepID=A0A1L3JE05_9SPHN|nr:alkaline phosphatase PhoX [Sphingorhabdus lutea]APG63339.1 phosphatase [Sphingorhabdus lutea]
MKISRRQLGFGMGGMAFAGIAARAWADSGVPVHGEFEVKGYGDLVTDPNKLLDLPKGFSYQVISRFTNIMDDGYIVPNAADGMGAFDLGNGKVGLIRNHELSPRDLRFGPFTDKVGKDVPAFDWMSKEEMPAPGGTTSMIYDMQSGKVEAEWLSLIGTIRNCSGGITPWGSWLTCEETVTKAGDGVGKDHGWVFEIPMAQKGLADPVPLKAMGRFNHEAAAVDPKSGIIYLTEDRGDGLFYRFIPNEKGNLAAGGKLQALSLGGLDPRNWDKASVETGQKLSVSWIDLDNVESPEDDLRTRGIAAGAAPFARGEGIYWGEGEFYFACTNGGAKKFGQIFRYTPSKVEGQKGEIKKGQSGILELFVESTNPAFYNYGDNLCVMPNGHLMVCEDQYTAITANHLRGIDASGKSYIFGRSHIQTEFAGACFSPDGSVMFVNLYSPTMTLAIKGPWKSISG